MNYVGKSISDGRHTIYASLLSSCPSLFFLLFKFDQDFGKCPITGEPMTMDDIVPVKAGKV